MSLGPVALVGSGEYLPVMTELERSLLRGSDRYVQIPTAAGTEGAGSIGRWVALGQQQAARIGATAVPVLAIDRVAADDPMLAEQVTGAGLVYLSGGNPTYCASTLRGSAVWTAALEAWRSGAGLAGCSAGAMSMTSWVPSIRNPLAGADPGLGLVPHLRVIPHFDKFLGWLPDLADQFLHRSPAGVTALGIDEDTALVWDPGSSAADAGWTVHGRQSVWILGSSSRSEFPSGSVLDLAAPVDPA